jgi:hypothetical protein
LLEGDQCGNLLSSNIGHLQFPNFEVCRENIEKTTMELKPLSNLGAMLSGPQVLLFFSFIKPCIIEFELFGLNTPYSRSTVADFNNKGGIAENKSSVII